MLYTHKVAGSIPAGCSPILLTFYHFYKILLHCPGIEPGSQEWESCMIPLHQQCPHNDKNVKFCQFIGQKGTQGAAGLAPRVTTIHPTSYKAKRLHCPGIEPGLQEWESCMIPLHQLCSHIDKKAKFFQFKGQKGAEGVSCLGLRVSSIHSHLPQSKRFALPGNRTRVARMGILHDTTTPAMQSH